MRNSIINAVEQNRLIVIVRGVYEEAAALADALYAGGVRMMEVTFDQQNTQKWEATCRAIRTIRDHMQGRMYVGAGTVTNVRFVQMAYDVGAQFIVSPDCRSEVIRCTRALGMVSMPGALSPTEISLARDNGADFVKVFPAAQLGPGYIKAIRGPLNNVRLLAVGGVNEHNTLDFIRAGCVGVGVGGNLVNKTWISAGKWPQITEAAHAFVQAVTEEE